MKKYIQLTMTILTCLSTMFLFPNNANAMYPTYLNGDYNYKFATGHMGQGVFVKMDSIRSVEYNPPAYRINVTIAVVSDADRGNTVVSKYVTKSLFYNYKLKTVTIYDIDNPSKSIYIHDKSSNASGAYPWRGVANIAFNAVYGMNFF